jgi:hypothetical protein
MEPSAREATVAAMSWSKVSGAGKRRVRFAQAIGNIDLIIEIEAKKKS